MLLRISLIIAIIGGLAVGGLNFVMVKEKITTLRTDRDTEKKAHEEFEGKFTTTKSQLDKTNAILKETQTTLATTTEQMQKAVEEATTQGKRAEKLTEDLGKTRNERDTAQNELAQYKQSGYSPDQVASMGKQYKTLQETLSGQQEENKLLGQKVTKLQNELDVYVHPEKFVLLPPGLKGQVVISDPKYKFVVLNVGEDQGLLEHGELLVNRNGRLVAKIKVSSVTKERSVANIIPGWQLSEVMEGDQVVPAHPAS
jgi:myosin heavy subunit